MGLKNIMARLIPGVNPWAREIGQLVLVPGVNAWARKRARRNAAEIFSLLLLTLALPVWGCAQDFGFSATNRLSIARTNQTIELLAKDLAPLGEKDLTKIHVRDSSGKELL